MPRRYTRRMTERTASAVDRIADSYVEKAVAADPLLATALGVPGHDREMSDFSPAALEREADLMRCTLRELDAAEQRERLDEQDRVTIAAMRDRFQLALAMHEKLIPHSTVNNISCPLQAVRSVFDQMPSTTGEHWDVIADRLAAIPQALDSFAHSLRYAADRGVLSPQRQLQIGADEARGFAETGGFFDEFIQAVPADLPEPLQRKLADASAMARGAYAAIANELESLMSQAPAADAVGEEVYRLFSYSFLGAQIDLDDTYEWGVQELLAIVAEQKEIAARLNQHYGNGGGDSIQAAEASLNADGRYLLHGTDALQQWMQQLSDRAVADLNGSHFDIPQELHRLECMIARTGSGGIYYTPPSEDLSRPGRMWWDVPDGVADFHTWQETTTVYHEGVPGHHLQCGIQAMQAAQLNRWRASFCWISGHGEGWALYAERLMDELGFLSADADRLGMLSAQRMRAGRVVLDIGLHCGKPVPAEFGGGEWTYDKAWEFMTDHWGIEENQRRFELHRYLGWPGQAPSYKVGQRIWERLRRESTLDSREFHERALRLGSLPLDILEQVLADESAAPNGADA